MEEKAPGLLLQAVPYLGQKKILKIFTPHTGLISLLARKNHNSGLLTPFCFAEWVYRKGKGDLYLLLDGALADDLAPLKASYKAVCAAGQIAKDLLSFQMPGTICPELFVLTSSIFQKLAAFEHPEVLVALFRLKWLEQEGLISSSTDFSFLAEEERAHIENLYSARTFSLLRALEPVFSLYPKISAFFMEKMGR